MSEHIARAKEQLARGHADAAAYAASAPIAPRESSTFRSGFLWLAGLASGLVGIGAGLYWAARRR